MYFNALSHHPSDGLDAVTQGVPINEINETIKSRSPYFSNPELFNNLMSPFG